MTDEPEQQQPKRRGEAAWAAAREGVAERNAQTRKEGRQRREAYERQKSDARRAREQRQMAELLGKRRTP